MTVTRDGHFVAPQSASVDTFDSAPTLDSRSAAIGRVRGTGLERLNSAAHAVAEDCKRERSRLHVLVRPDVAAELQTCCTLSAVTTVSEWLAVRTPPSRPARICRRAIESMSCENRVRVANAPLGRSARP